MQEDSNSSSKGHELMDGSNIKALVENEELFNTFVTHKFQQLDADCDGKLSVQELQPAVADLGAALGLPALGTSPESDHIYSQVLDEFTHGKHKKVSKNTFKGVLSDILLGMAAGLKRDPVVILRIDGEDLHEFLKSPAFEPDILSIFSEIESPDGSLKDHIIKAYEKLPVDKGMPPAIDPWVMNNVVEPSVASLGAALQQPVSQETFLSEFKRSVEYMVQLLKEQPAIVAHSQNTFDGSGARKLLSNKFELDKVLDSVLNSGVPKDKNGKISQEYLGRALDLLAPSAGLPPLGAVNQMDEIMSEALKMVDPGEGKLVKEEEFRKLVAEVLGSIMLQLEGKPVSVSINSVVHEPLASSSTLLQPATTP